MRQVPLPIRLKRDKKVEMGQAILDEALRGAVQSGRRR